MDVIYVFDANNHGLGMIKMKYSAQRELIKQKVIGNRQHLTADEVYLMVKQEMPNISLATVYRNLNMLVEAGLIAKIAFPNASDRFDGCTAEHFHMVCVRCGAIFDIEDEMLQDLDDKIYSLLEFEVLTKHFVAKGVCKKCNELDQIT